MTDLTAIAELLTDIERRAAARHRVTIAMIRRVGKAVTDAENQLDKDLDAIEASEATEATTEATELAELQRIEADLVAKSNAGTITPEEHQRLAQVKDRIDAITAQEQANVASIETADPSVTTPAAPTDPAAGGTATGVAPVVSDPAAEGDAPAE